MNETDEIHRVEVTETASVIKRCWPHVPTAAIILGTGLGSLTDHIQIEAEWNYGDLPHFAKSTATGHRGRLICGRLNGVPIVAMDGRFHAYEGYSAQQITFPVRVLSALGSRFLIASNASGGLNQSLISGDILLIDDHVNLMWCDPLRSLQQSDDSSSPRPSAAFYDPHLLSLAQRIADDEHISLKRGTYVAMLGPNYETRAEYRWLRTLGDVVGMSTVPEVIVARQIGLPTIAFSMVTNVFRPDEVQQTTGDEVISAATNSEPLLRRIVVGLLGSVS